MALMNPFHGWPLSLFSLGSFWDSSESWVDGFLYSDPTELNDLQSELLDAFGLQPNNSFKPNLLRGPAHAVTCTTPPYRYTGRLNSGVR